MLAALLTCLALGAQPAPVTPWRALVAETAFDLRVQAGELRLGLAGDTTSVTLTLRPTDVRRFADSLLIRLADRRGRRPWTLRLEEPGVSPGTLSVSGERGAGGRWSYRLFAADDVTGGVRDAFDATQLRLVARKLREAAVAATPRRARRR